jgi:hypothetical protein
VTEPRSERPIETESVVSRGDRIWDGALLVGLLALCILLVVLL